jgi:hypothetical protein
MTKLLCFVTCVSHSVFFYTHQAFFFVYGIWARQVIMKACHCEAARQG